MNNSYVKYKVIYTKKYKKAYKRYKHNKKLVSEIKEIMRILAFDEPIPKSYKDHELVGNLKGFRELHIRPDVLLVYEKQDSILTLLLVNMGSHSELFK